MGKRSRNLRNRGARMKRKNGRWCGLQWGSTCRASLTCLCLYSRRQAIMWVDMIADDLLAAVREDTKRTQ